MYQIRNNVTPPDSEDLVSIEEMKGMLNIPPTDTSKDQQLSFLISEVSVAMARAVNRTFGYAKWHETFYDIGTPPSPKPRLFFREWPVKFADIETMTLNGVDIKSDLTWELEEATGTLYVPGGGGWAGGDLDVVYSAGYHLPDDAPKDLKFAADIATREAYWTYQRGMLASGVRMLAHKGARIQFQQAAPGGITSSSGLGVSPQTWQSVQGVLDHYFRHWL